MDVKYR